MVVTDEVDRDLQSSVGFRNVSRVILCAYMYVVRRTYEKERNEQW